MKRQKNRKIVLGIVLVALIAVAAFIWWNAKEVSEEVQKDNEKIVVYEFYGETCPHCQHLNAWLDDIKPKYPNLELKQYEIYESQTNRDYMKQMADAYGQKATGVPTLFIADKMFVGFNDERAQQIEDEIKRCLDAVCETLAVIEE